MDERLASLQSDISLLRQELSNIKSELHRTNLRIDSVWVFCLGVLTNPLVLYAFLKSLA